jgi:hypothetical protein
VPAAGVPAAGVPAAGVPAAMVLFGSESISRNESAAQYQGSGESDGCLTKHVLISLTE